MIGRDALSGGVIWGRLAPTSRQLGIEAKMIRTERRSVPLDAGTNSRAALFAAALMLAIFGAGLIYAVGFAGADMLHNVAHDTRHANGFPCH